jgi:DNA-binding GntR family transcriptional regulator
MVEYSWCMVHQPTILTPVPATSRADMVAETIERAVLRGDLVPGSRLVERELAAQLGVSKTPVREALKELTRRGLVVQRAYRATEVRIIDRATSEAIYEVRLLLEPEAVRRAVESAPPGAFEAAREALKEAARAGAEGDMAELSLLNRRFHRALYAPNPNQLLRDTLDGLQDQVALVSVSAWRRASSWSREAKEHQAILSAALRGEAERAGELLRAHIEGFASRLHDANTNPGG